jgi:hypothetical protein
VRATTTTRRAPKATSSVSPRNLPPDVPAEFSLRALIREQLETSPDPHVVAALVLKRIPEGELRGCLAQCLHMLVMEENRRGAGGLVVVAASGGHGDGRSRRWAGAASTFRQLRKAFAVDGNGEWKRLADMTPEDCEVAALLREVHAEREIRVAKQLRHLAALARQHKATVIGGLPAEVLDEALS